MQMQPQKQRDAFESLLETFTFQDDAAAMAIAAIGKICELKDDDAFNPEAMQDALDDLQPHVDLLIDTAVNYIERDIAEELAGSMPRHKNEDLA